MIEVANRAIEAQIKRESATVTTRRRARPASLCGPLVAVYDRSASGLNAVRTATRVAARTSQTVEVVVPLSANDGDWGGAGAANSIVATARAAGASLMIVPLGWLRHPGPPSGIAMLRAIIDGASVPVLAVAAGRPSSTRNVVVGTDFGSSHIDAARLALSIADDAPRIRVVHVVPGPEEPAAAVPEWQHLYERGAAELLAITQQMLDGRRSADVSTVLLHGRPAPVLMTFARAENAQLIALGSHNQNGQKRLTLGSVAEAVLRDSPCSVLIAPPPVHGSADAAHAL